ncbi:hypothetical protein [Fusibacter sp. 3D3]|uniref:hypothetical protein n=1 Tax=Fusibacter sp. 3D3 TaxID=1048380 RepID=UPI000852974A|nr:hypothetical protein [Fusibacter sp. 3D3]GAU75741.1 hypothetical protein F3D3_0332 [Fusibacter sp. 3D3]
MKKKAKEKKRLDPYKIDLLSSIPIPIQVGVSKWWCYAATYYFIGFGMPMLMHSVIDSIFVLGLVLGLVQTFVVNFVVKGICGKEEVFNKYLAIRMTSPFRIVVQVLYSWVLIVLIAMTYQIFNTVLSSMYGYEEGVVVLGVEPVLFGILLLIYDTLFIKAFSKKTFRKKQSRG